MLTSYPPLPRTHLPPHTLTPTPSLVSYRHSVCHCDGDWRHDTRCESNENSQEVDGRPPCWLCSYLQHGNNGYDALVPVLFFCYHEVGLVELRCSACFYVANAPSAHTHTLPTFMPTFTLSPLSSPHTHTEQWRQQLNREGVVEVIVMAMKRCSSSEWVQFTAIQALQNLCNTGIKLCPIVGVYVCLGKVGGGCRTTTGLLSSTTRSIVHCR